MVNHKRIVAELNSDLDKKYKEVAGSTFPELVDLKDYIEWTEKGTAFSYWYRGIELHNTTYGIDKDPSVESEVKAHIVEVFNFYLDTIYKLKL